MTYSDGDHPLWAWESPHGGNLMFATICPTCNRFVSPDKTLEFEESMDGIYKFGDNATCKKHGRVSMPFVGDI